MDDEERRYLREAMELEQEEGYIRDKLKKEKKQQLEVAIFLRARYESYMKVGFTEDKAFALMVNDSALLYQAMFRKSDDSNNRKFF